MVSTLPPLLLLLVHLEQRWGQGQQGDCAGNASSPPARMNCPPPPSCAPPHARPPRLPRPTHLHPIPIHTAGAADKPGMEVPAPGADQPAGDAHQEGKAQGGASGSASRGLMGAGHGRARGVPVDVAKAVAALDGVRTMEDLLPYIKDLYDMVRARARVCGWVCSSCLGSSVCVCVYVCTCTCM